MLAIAGQATKPNWRIFFRKSRDVHGYWIKNIFFNSKGNAWHFSYKLYKVI